MLFIHLRLPLPSGLFPSDFPNIRNIYMITREQLTDLIQFYNIFEKVAHGPSWCWIYTGVPLAQRTNYLYESGLSYKGVCLMTLFQSFCRNLYITVRMASSGMLRRVTLVRADVHRFLSPWWRRHQVPPKRRFLQEPHGVTTQKTPFFLIEIVSWVLFRLFLQF
jgi:hypothetical protein